MNNKTIVKLTEVYMEEGDESNTLKERPVIVNADFFVFATRHEVDMHKPGNVVILGQGPSKVEITTVVTTSQVMRVRETTDNIYDQLGYGR